MVEGTSRPIWSSEPTGFTVRATVLAAQLSGDTDIPTALTHYDQLRRPRSQRVQHLARQDPKISLSTNPLTYGLMTRLTQMAGGAVAARKSAPLWDWTPPALDAHHSTPVNRE
ncbi:hypothetical protein [Nocardia sp. NPDC004711]